MAITLSPARHAYELVVRRSWSPREPDTPDIMSKFDLSHDCKFTSLSSFSMQVMRLSSNSSIFRLANLSSPFNSLKHFF